MTSSTHAAFPPLSPRTSLLLVLLATAAAYAWTLQFGFVYDDLGQIIGNPYVQSWRYFPQYFHGNVWLQQTPVGNYYRPIFLIWLLINHTLFGVHATFWHLTSIGVHLAVTALVFLLARRLTGHNAVAVLTALFFGLHPAHIESVAWISGVTDPLLALFLVPSFLAFLNYREKRGAKWLALSVVLFTFALLAKETAVVLPALAVLYLLLSPDGDWQKKLSDSGMLLIPYAAVGFIYLLVRSDALRGIAHQTANLPDNVALLTVPSVLWFYLKTLLLPVGLSAFYDIPYVTHVSFKYLLGPLLGVLVVLAALAWWARKSKSPAVAMAAGWLLLPLLPVLYLSLLPLGDFVHDRYLYLPSIGFSLLLALLLVKLNSVLFAGRPLGTGIAVLIAIAMAAGTIAQSWPWRDDLLLYTHGMQVAPNNDLPRGKLADTFVARGMYERGIRLYRFVLSLDPDYWYANSRLGYALYMTGHYDEAQKVLAKSVANHPSSDALYYLALTDTKLGQPKAAEEAIRAAIKLDSNAVGYSYALGVALKEQGNYKEALDAFHAELGRNPNDPGTQAQIADIEARENAAPDKRKRK